MFLKPRPNTFTLYRLFFVCLLLSMAFAGISASLLAYQGSALLQQNLPGIDLEAFMVATGIGGIISLLYGSLLLHMISDRREKGDDRRQRQVAIDFPDRRTSNDRRVAVQEESANLQLPGYPRYHA